jgi:hypothetical protein
MSSLYGKFTHLIHYLKSHGKEDFSAQIRDQYVVISTKIASFAVL